MSMLNPFTTDAFNMVALTAAINRIPNTYGRLEQLALMPATGVRLRTIIIEEMSGVLNLLPTQPVGAPGTLGTQGKRKVRIGYLLETPVWKTSYRLVTEKDSVVLQGWAIVENTTGLGRPGKPAIVFSANNGSDAPNDFTQCIFVSTDGGMTVRRDPAMMYKPLPADAARRGGGTRDPMILWYAPEKKWVMVVYNQPPGGKHD